MKDIFFCRQRKNHFYFSIEMGKIGESFMFSHTLDVEKKTKTDGIMKFHDETRVMINVLSMGFTNRWLNSCVRLYDSNKLDE